jgi:undecaprenyl-diphosphatase
MNYQFVSYLRELDLSIFHAINGFCGQNLKLDQFVFHFNTLRGSAFMGTFGVLWFQRADDQARRRETLVIMLFAILLSIVAARAMAILLPFRIRPMFISDIGYHAPLFSVVANIIFEDWSSFPSDTATYFFVLATGFWFLSRWWGFLWVCYSIIVVLGRVYFGIHYPSDVLVGALLGISVAVVMISNEFLRARIASPIVAAERRAPAIFYGLLFPILFETGTVFHFTRVMRHVVFQTLFGH